MSEPNNDEATSRRWPDRATRRAEILSAAQKIFVESGYAGARTQKIAQAAGVTEPVVYKHFGSKRELFEAAILDPLRDMIAEIANKADGLSGDDDASARRRRFIEMHELISRTCMELVPLLGVALFEEGGAEFYRDTLLPELERAYAITEEMLGSWPLHVELDGRTAFTMAFGMHLGLALDAHMRSAEPPAPNVAETLANIVVRGISR